MRVVTIRFEVTEDTLKDAENPIFDSEIILGHVQTQSAMLHNQTFRSNCEKSLLILVKIPPEDDFVGAATWLSFIVIIVGGIVITVRIYVVLKKKRTSMQIGSRRLSG